jgi:hypothetical protein
MSRGRGLLSKVFKHDVNRKGDEECGIGDGRGSSFHRPERAAKDRANMMINYHPSEEDLSSDESVIGESGSESDDSSGDNGDIIGCDYANDDSLCSEDVIGMDDISTNNDNDYHDDDDDIEDILPLRERISMASGSNRTECSNMKASSGRIWSTIAPSTASGRSSKANICREGEFRVKVGARVDSAREIMLLFIESIIQESVRYTNLQGKRQVNEWNSKHSSKRHWKAVDAIEMEAFIGLHILSGTIKAQYRSTEDLWSERDGLPVFRATMTRERFCALKSAMRFDDPLRRDRTDRLAPIRHIFETFSSNLRSFVVAGPHLTVDEQLVEFHGRVIFKQYIPSKPGKFGIKIFWVCDADTTYCLNGLVYIGKGSVAENILERSNSIPEAVVMQLCGPFLNKGRNITADNWFTSFSLVQHLLQQDTTYIGTARRNNRDLPPVARETRNRERGDTKYYYSDNILLCSYWDKGSKPVLLLDSFARIGRQPQPGSKSDTVSFYNKTKSGVDNLDHMIRNYSCKRKCRRWPYSLMMNMVDVAGVNGSIIFIQTQGEFTKHGKSHAHLHFLKSAGYQLVDAQIQRRISSQRLSGPASLAIQLLGYQHKSFYKESKSHLLEKYARCALCPREKDKKVKVCCTSCGKAMCNDHRAFLCVSCYL